MAGSCARAVRRGVAGRWNVAEAVDAHCRRHELVGRLDRRRRRATQKGKSPACGALETSAFRYEPPAIHRLACRLRPRPSRCSASTRRARRLNRRQSSRHLERRGCGAMSDSSVGAEPEMSVKMCSSVSGSLASRPTRTTPCSSVRRHAASPLEQV